MHNEFISVVFPFLTRVSNAETFTQLYSTCFSDVLNEKPSVKLYLTL